MVSRRDALRDGAIFKFMAAQPSPPSAEWTPPPEERPARSPVDPRPAPDPHWRFSTDQVLKMVEVGILGEGDRVELVRGELLEMPPPQSPEHRTLKDRIYRRLLGAYRDLEFSLLGQGPVRAGPQGLPEPDLAVLRGADDLYMHKHPEGTDTVLILEVAMSSRGRDARKASDYAASGVPTYWLLDIVGRTLSVYTEPDRERALYRKVVTLDEKESVFLPEVGIEWKVATLLA